VGAVPGSRLLSVRGAAQGEGSFDVEPFRSAGRRVVLRDVERPLVVLGSTQPDSVLDAERARQRGVGVVRRRSGGGAVLLLPAAQVWADMWVPRGDPLWSPEPHASAVVAGEWWARALGLRGLEVHRGGSVQRPGSDVICFAGVGPGEVHHGGRKLVGLAQWRSREGVLVHGCAYRRWDPLPLVDVLARPASARTALASALRGAAVGFDQLAAAEPWGPAALLGALPDPSTWEIVRA
jgi:lipoate-protein ligase A